VAKTEGIFAEPAGGVAVAVLKKLVESGEIPRDEEVVCCVTGSGFKASEAILECVPKPVEIDPFIDQVVSVVG